MPLSLSDLDILSRVGVLRDLYSFDVNQNHSTPVQPKNAKSFGDNSLSLVSYNGLGNRMLSGPASIAAG